MTESNELHFGDLEKRVTKIEEYIRCNKEAKEQEWKNGINNKLEVIKKRQIRAEWQWLAAFGLATAAIGYHFYVTGAKYPIASAILMIIGLLLLVGAPLFGAWKSKSRP